MPTWRRSSRGTERNGRVEGRQKRFDTADCVAMTRPIRDIANESGRSAAAVGYALFACDAHVRSGTLC
ncbi:hypothetical protein KVP04_01295 [Halobacterium salinarum]|uniref:hypothetical protein n=1 Tax=Halobacterium salinarum TaxID=2242 RepID=UPI001F17452E|nr:hypothetical protein [Halobacterium salinarum]MCF2166074.1 hypothetical protein [Halobacterium salinarum]MCF2166832.1 hypothetical protein [Halobacterium salinarum]MCF2237766.1 hypothetical protein [Halobacterium salinarum]